ncbi:hypothetical protein A3B42_05165 [Candidatus Daviesbacteria bacterium RIFCSPLOWO2_01_FULL_38_10]|nr:MAG: hypothetical protein A3D02_00265 [Candidatus Daviesbacteria bacterium RIFCSPHIGHO2_02_FULL_39_41]OGE38980.1 MAG: hypothetical protein A3B42_05165 [Candidatus Daviesbacteria bacterium RIFCSPLOWO2_01_FULL_38_10]OGE45466.1 MAG: hypothetical protein A3E67_03755 [Candidatus Daviesbacteria bacterium RIFCSPHIGHO2_12_FULL_38_25]OGE67552.1 MAG: hypothetical protein A3H81_00900 [Candidatus Daviesbacteria bacterium RIFCSPLOWO2_02_FULL_38_18]OGE72772.1 MAG: hypothetical protein A3H18_03870 [Candida
MKKYILGVKIDDVNMEEALETVHHWLQKSTKKYIVTPNPEFIMTAQKDPEFKKILNDADLSIPDGEGLKLSGKIKNTVTGVDLMEKLVEKSVDWGFAVGLLGGMDGVAEKAVECLQKKYPKIKISFAISDLTTNYPLRQSYSEASQLPTTDLLFVALGHSKQEKWIVQNLPKLKVKVAMGVGGAFDYFSGKVPRAPKWIRDLGFEWLFRLMIQPWRIKRQISLVKYLWLVMLS